MQNHAVIALTLAQEAEDKAGHTSAECVIERAKAYLGFLVGEPAPPSKKVTLPQD